MAVGTAGAVLGAVIVAVVVGGGRAAAPVVTAGITVLSGWALLAVGLIATTRLVPPRVGRLMVLVGAAQLLAALVGSADAALFTVGLAAQPLALAVYLQLVLSFPDGRLSSPAARLLVGLGYLDAVVLQLVMVLFMDAGEAPGCPCPRNLLLVAADPDLHALLMGTQRVLGMGIVLASVVLLARRWRRATRPRRRTLSPVLATGAVAVVLTGVALAWTQLAPGPGADVAGLVARGAVVGVPVGLLVGLARVRLGHAAMGALVVELGGTAPRRDLRAALSRALGDPELSVAYRLEGTDRYVDAEGRATTLPDGSGDRVATLVQHDGDPIAAVVHDASLVEDPTLVRAACAAAGLALSNERLQAELRARLADLRASRARVVRAADLERRRLEGNLHDGAQQRLVSVAMTLGLAAARLPADPPGARSLLDEAQDDLATALAEVRELARGLHPAVLGARGLAVAVGSLVEGIPAALSITADITPERLAEPVEVAAYYVVAEALANVVKHAHGTHAGVTITRAAGELTVMVEDDGVGGADPSHGSGLLGLADRVGALDGRLSVASPLGAGTTLTARLPCA